MDEDHFLKARKERDDARIARQNAEASEDTVAREEFAVEVERLKREVDAATAAATVLAGKEDEKQAALTEATNYFRLLQAHIQRGADILDLPPHETKSANSTLANCLAAIDTCRNAAKPVKKFAFSKKKAVTTTVVKKDGVESYLTPTSLGGISATQQSTDPALTYADKENAIVYVSSGKAAFIRRCKNCTFLVLPVAGSCFLSDCENCTIYTACHQMRIKSCTNVSVYVWCSSIPVIEDCKEMRFGPYSAWSGLLKTSDPQEVGVDMGEATATPTLALSTHIEWITSVGRITDIEHAQKSFKKVDDFDWLKQQQSPNWRLLAEEEYVVSEEPFVVAK